MTNMPRLITKLAYDSEDRNYTLQRIANVALLVIDDLGVERDTTYSLEKIYEIFDTRFRAKKPLIVTTNISAKAMKDEQNAEYKRIYDRILQMCYPIAVLGESRRAKAAQQSSEFMSEFLGTGEQKIKTGPNFRFKTRLMEAKAPCHL